MTTYRVNVGINYGKSNKRAEPGDLVTDLPTKAAEWMVPQGIIEKVDTPKEDRLTSTTPAKKLSSVSTKKTTKTTSTEKASSDSDTSAPESSGGAEALIVKESVSDSSDSTNAEDGS